MRSAVRIRSAAPNKKSSDESRSFSYLELTLSCGKRRLTPVSFDVKDTPDGFLSPYLPFREVEVCVPPTSSVRSTSNLRSGVPAKPVFRGVMWAVRIRPAAPKLLILFGIRSFSFASLFSQCWFCLSWTVGFQKETDRILTKM